MREFRILLCVIAAFCFSNVFGFQNSVQRFTTYKETQSLKSSQVAKSSGSMKFNSVVKHAVDTKRSALVNDDVMEIESGPVLSAKKRAVVDGFVSKMGGKRTIQRILIANNGMAATKAIMSMRQWAYMVLGDEKALEIVALATRDDLNANAEFIRLADTFVEVPSGSNKNNYANVDLIVDIAVAQKVDAVWPGWGHASENPKLPSTLKQKGIEFIGPSAAVMSALGDKISANILAQTALVPSIPWSGANLTSGLNAQGVIPQEIFDSACINTAEEAAAMADVIGYPVMIKASEGGGGKGIRMVRDPSELRTNFIQVQNEVPGSPIFMMQLCTNARHLEVQIVGDEYGNAVALNGRDCSTQRRFQKIFEEGPPIVAPRDVFREMERSAQRLTQSIGYVGAGTVEYLYNTATNKYFFLELNPRLQVEHPVTEGLTGVNLPSVQLQVAMGIPLDRIPEIREFYGQSADSPYKPIDFMKDDYVYPQRHIIAARITAENPDEGFKPTSGKIERVKFQSTPKVWGYFSVGANGGIHEFADSQFGHLFASGPTREEARKNLVLALKEIDVRGDIRTTVEYLIKLLETKEFKDNTIDTAWLDGIIREKAVSVLVDPQVVALSAAVYKAHSTVATQTADFVETLAKGQTSLQAISSMLSFPIEITYDNVKYSFTATTLGPSYYSLKINGQTIPVRVREQPDKSLLCNVAGENMQLFGQSEALGLRMKINGQTVMIPTIYNPSELRSDVTGKIVRYLQNDRDFVDKNQPYVEVEAMKMIMSLKATEAGAIRHALSPGSILSAGDLVATLDLKDPSKVKQITSFSGRLQNIPPESVTPSADDAAESVSLALDGYEHENFESSVGVFMNNATLDQIETFLATQFSKFLASEQVFGAQEETSVVSTLAKGNKDHLADIVPHLLAKKQSKSRAAVVLSLLRQLEFLPERFPGYSLTLETMSEKLASALHGLSNLNNEHSEHCGAVALKTKQILDSSVMPPFQTRLDALKAELVSSSADLNSLSKQPNIAVSVDLLVLLMKDSSATVRRSAMEVYIRRVYRAHCIKSLVIEEKDGTLSAHWSFTLRDTVDDRNTPVRYGYMNMLGDVSQLEKQLPSVMKHAAAYLKRGTHFKEPINVLHIGFTHADGVKTENQISATVQTALAAYKPSLASMDVRMVNVLLVNPSAMPQSTANTHNSNKRVGYFNYYSDSNFQEDYVSRHLRPTMPQLLELNRLAKNHDLTRMPTVGRNSFMYLGKEKTGGKEQQEVLFLRSITHTAESVTPGGAERIVLMALDELERAQLDPRVSDTASSRLFVNVIPDINMHLDESVSKFSRIMDQLIAKYATRLLKLRVDEIEVKIRVLDNEAIIPISNPNPNRFKATGKAPQASDSSDVNHTQSEYVPVRLIASSSTGGWLSREAYREYLDPVSGQATQYCSLNSLKDTRIDKSDKGVCILDPYPTSNVLQKKRAIARKVGSTYATDFLGLVEVALISSWQSYFESASQGGSTPPPNLLTFEELVLDDKTHELVKIKRFPGANKIGMLAWHTTLKTPHYPEGREVVFIANDVTVQSGSFGVREDEFFYKASEYARVRGLPRVFISCNSGARIGLVDELKPKFKVAFKDESNPTAGFDYLYLSEEDYKALPKGTVDATVLHTSTGETRYVLDAIIGQTHGIGVENLRGSGLIAGETSRAYDETFTLSYVTGRSVGIGAYLNRLGQRVIQMQHGPMILTGYSALNKLLGKEVYTSQDQLGGPQVMYPNGVTHEVVANDREGIQAVVDWLSYTPKTFNSTAPPLPHSATLIDPPERLVEFLPTKTPYDPRHMLAGTTNADGTHVSGFFDKGSFKEYLGGWGKSVVAGRARLGGINVGVIAVETRLVEQRIPADPGNPESRESIQPQAGQVWYPDSAYKTAQVISDFNRGENLPLIIFANWRGFSGGTRDMYGEILKYGAMIVDSLRLYKHPVFVYIPPGGELRGGAWVVIDPTINPAKMEMFADKQARGGILEPPGICEVKFRSQEQVVAMHRLDPLLLELDEEAHSLSSALSANNERSVLNKEIKAREKTLGPLYTQIAHEFADLHDRAGRMKAKGCIDEVLEWRTARGFFYWRILKRQQEEMLKERVSAAAKGALSDKQMKDMIYELIPAANKQSDKHIVQWFAKSADLIDSFVAKVQLEHTNIAIHNMLKGLSDKDRSDVISTIKK